MSIIKITNLLDYQEKKKALILIVLNFFSSFLDLFGIASILPFIAVLTEPESVYKNKVLSYLYEYFNFTEINSFLVFLGFGTLILIAVSNTFKIILNYFQLRFVFDREYSVSNRLMEKYLGSNYEWFLDKNTSNLGKKILSEVTEIINSSLLPLLHLISNSIIIFIIIIFILFINPVIALFTFFSFGLTYYFFYNIIKSRISNYGRGRLSTNKKRFHIINEAFKNIKEIKIRNIEHVYKSQYKTPSNQYAKYKALTNVFAVIPKFFIEILAFGGIVLIVIYSLSNELDLELIVPLMALYAFAGYRVLPAMQLVYASITNMNYSLPSLNEILDDLNDNKIQERDLTSEKIQFKNSIFFNNISFSYTKDNNMVLSNINFSIKKQSSIGIVGESGSGKSTLINIITGLLFPEIGTIKVDKFILSKNNLKSYQQKIGYVGQNISIIDSSIIHNIAFGEDADNINLDKIKQVCKIVDLDTYIENSLEKKYYTVLGEDGVLFSGGQRQRIIIARALYFDPEILILDEATSSLDPNVEKLVLENINKYYNLTMIQVSHRYATLKNTEKIIYLKSGFVKDIDTLENLSKKDTEFIKLFNL